MSRMISRGSGTRLFVSIMTFNNYSVAYKTRQFAKIRHAADPNATLQVDINPESNAGSPKASSPTNRKKVNMEANLLKSLLPQDYQTTSTVTGAVTAAESPA